MPPSPSWRRTPTFSTPKTSKISTRMRSPGSTSAAGITSGLAALGLGAGMIPGIGVATLIGTVAFVGLNKLLDTGNRRKKEQHRNERERKAQLAMENLQETINHLIGRMARLQGEAADAKANKEAIGLLNERLTKLQQVLARRKEATVAQGA